MLAVVFDALGGLLMAWRVRAVVGVDVPDDLEGSGDVPGVSWLVAALRPVVVLLLTPADCYLFLPRRPRR